MAKTPLFDRVTRIARIGSYCSTENVGAAEGIERLAELELRRHRAGYTRRDALTAGGLGALAAAMAPLVGRKAWGRSTKKGSSARVAIVGGGIAGLCAADRLESAGIVPVIFDSNSRLGGRIKSYRGFPSSQVSEAGGEMIDTGHKTMIAYARELGLTLEDYNKASGDDLFYFFDGLIKEADIVDEYCGMVANMRPDLQACSGAPTYYDHTAADVVLDTTNLRTYLDTRAADLPKIREVLAQAYIAEYGLEPEEQSALNMLLLLHLDCSRTFREFGVFSDERYHVVEGNDQITAGIQDRLSATIETGAKLTKLAKNSSGEYLLYFNKSATPQTFDAVVIAIPFSVLRSVTLDASLGLSAAKQNAINTLGYGANCKTSILFDGRAWYDLANSNGTMYSDLPNFQNSWESNWTKAGDTAILTDYAGGTRGKNLQVVSTGSYCGSCHTGPVSDLNIDGALIQSQVADFLAELERMVPGIRSRALTASNGDYYAFRGHWLPQSGAKGSYTCYGPGQFTGVAGLEGESVDALKFAGEHTDSFYDWQGFMEGGANSGIAAADEILADIKAGRI